MKKTIVIAALLALSFTTGFTCSKNTPPEQQPSAQDQMAQPAAPAEGQPAQDNNMAAPAAGEQQPGAAAPAPDQSPNTEAPAGETH